MKNIFLTVDFSKKAYQAALYAAELAHFTGARLILFHAYNHTDQPEDEDKSGYITPERKVQEKLDAMARKIKSLTDISITRLLKPGNVVEETLYVATKIKADLIILGLKNSAPKQFRKAGTAVNALLEKCTLPLLLLPPKAMFEPYKLVQLVTDVVNSEQPVTNLKFLTLLFSNFENVQLLSRKDLTAEAPSTSKLDGLLSGPALVIPVLIPAENILSENLPDPFQLIVKTYTSVYSHKPEVELVERRKLAEHHLPVLLLPVSNQPDYFSGEAIAV